MGKQPSPEAVDNEVLRLAALGDFNKHAERWRNNLQPDARNFIEILLKVKPCARPSASEALHHPFLTNRTTRSQEPSVFFQGKVSAWGDRDRAWSQLDGLQRLGWVAVARAVAEPELDRSVIVTALDGVETADDSFAANSGQGREATYLWQLARELGTTPVFQWLQ